MGVFQQRRCIGPSPAEDAAEWICVQPAYGPRMCAYCKAKIETNIPHIHIFVIFA